MGILDIAAVLVSIAAVFSFINARYIHLPGAIGMMLIALVMSLFLLGLGALGFGSLKEDAAKFVGSIDFNATLMNGMLSFLLFAGALHVHLNDLAEQKWLVGLLATIGTVTSTFLVGLLFSWLTQAFGVHLDFMYCLLFGALISPTDPIAVMGILKSVGAPKSLETKITGESLFNDGIGVVVFLVLMQMTVSEAEAVVVSDVAKLFAVEAIGGLLLGLVLGGVGYWMLARVDDYAVEILVTLAIVMGGYALALAVHTSGPIAMVVAGLLIGNHGRSFAMSEQTRQRLDTFWELIDEILNAVLFVLIGLEILLLSFDGDRILIGLLAIPLVLLCRFVCVGAPIKLLSLGRTFSPGVVRILTWGGLRGGISIALALSIPAGPERDLILAVTYAVVVFSILVQGLTVGRLIKRVAPVEHAAQ